ncbi:MAG: hypothetical protein ACP5UC_02570 [Candidatus Micrarchaeia archaeon]
MQAENEKVSKQKLSKRVFTYLRRDADLIAGAAATGVSVISSYFLYIQGDFGNAVTEKVPLNGTIHVGDVGAAVTGIGSPGVYNPQIEVTAPPMTTPMIDTFQHAWLGIVQSATFKEQGGVLKVTLDHVITTGTGIDLTQRYAIVTAQQIGGLPTKLVVLDIAVAALTVAGASLIFFGLLRRSKKTNGNDKEVTQA